MSCKKPLPSLDFCPPSSFGPDRDDDNDDSDHVAVVVAPEMSLLDLLYFM